MTATAPTSRQVRRAAERKAIKVATRPGLRPAPKTPAVERKNGPGSFERHVLTLTPFGAEVERSFHFTKGHRQRRVGMPKAAS